MNCIFETNFDAEPVAAPPRDADPAAQEIAAREAALRAAAYEEGYAAGLAATRADEDRSLHETLAAMTRELGALHAEAAAHRAAMEAQALEFARAACERLAPELVAALGGARAAAEVRRCLALVVGSPRIDVALSPAALASHGESLEQALKDAGPDGGTCLRGDPDLGQGDARMRWAGGEMSYSMDDALGGLIGALRAQADAASGQGRHTDG